MENVANLPEVIASVGGIVITLALAYIPRLQERWEALEGTEKRAVLGLLYLLVSAGLYVPSCLGGPTVVACTTASIWDVALAFVLALMASQGTYTLLPDERKAADRQVDNRGVR